ncbi:MAG: HD domain-containing phosphohydrolase [Pseudomonadota bacterium]
MSLDSIEEVAERQNFYASHLAEVNKQMDVVSTENIYNKNGVLIVPKGMHISSDVAKKILAHKLENPLEEQVRLGDTITHTRLLYYIGTLLKKYGDLYQIHARNCFDKSFENLVVNVKISPILLQKLTVLQKQLPKEYDKSLFCGWLAALIAHEMKLETQLVAHAFIAGLVHDIGLLNICPDILNKKSALTAGEWRAIQSHVVVGKLLLINMRDIHASVATAVLEHHERCDGSGYPIGKSEENLTVLGQVVAMADSMQSIRINQFEKLGRNMRDALPYLHMNSTIHFQKVYEAMCSILKKSALNPTAVNPFSGFPQYIAHLIKRGTQLKKVVEILEPLVQMTTTHKDEKKCAMKLWKVSQPVVQMIFSSGLLTDHFMDCLHKFKKDPDGVAMEELCEVELMQNELYWQIKKIDKSIDGCLEENHSAMESQSRKVLEDFSRHLKEVLAG